MSRSIHAQCRGLDSGQGIDSNREEREQRLDRYTSGVSDAESQQTHQEQDHDTSCCICLYAPEHVVVCVWCAGRFCNDCISSWVRQCDATPTCPLCRHEVTHGDLVYAKSQFIPRPTHHADTMSTISSVHTDEDGEQSTVAGSTAAVCNTIASTIQSTPTTGSACASPMSIESSSSWTTPSTSQPLYTPTAQSDRADETISWLILQRDRLALRIHYTPSIRDVGLAAIGNVDHFIQEYYTVRSHALQGRLTQDAYHRDVLDKIPDFALLFYDVITCVDDLCDSAQRSPCRNARLHTQQPYQYYYRTSCPHGFH